MLATQNPLNIATFALLFNSVGNILHQISLTCAMRFSISWPLSIVKRNNMGISICGWSYETGGNSWVNSHSCSMRLCWPLSNEMIRSASITGGGHSSIWGDHTISWPLVLSIKCICIRTSSWVCISNWSTSSKCCNTCNNLKNCFVIDHKLYLHCVQLFTIHKY